MVKKYDLAVSYASEQAEYVEAFVKRMKKRRFKIYLYTEEQEIMLGSILHEKLQEIYSDESMTRLIFLSNEYLKKSITRMEADVIIAEYTYERSNMYVFRFDDSHLPGLNRNFVYASIDKYPCPNDFADFMCQVIKKKQ